MKKFLVFVMVIAMMFFTVVPAFADAVSFNTKLVDYYVYVDTPDGGLNMRSGPGTDYPIVLDKPIPDGVSLHIVEESKTGNWGLTEYGGAWGFVYLPQTSSTPPTTTPPTTPPPPPPETSYIYVPVSQETTKPTTTKPTTTEPTTEPAEETTIPTISLVSENPGNSYDSNLLLIAIIIVLVVAVAVLLIFVVNSKNNKNNQV